MNENLPADGREDFYWQITVPTAQGRPVAPQVEIGDEWVDSEFVSEVTTTMDLPDGQVGVPALRSTWRALVSGPYAEDNPNGVGVLTEGDTPIYVKIENDRERVIRPAGMITVTRRS